MESVTWHDVVTSTSGNLRVEWHDDGDPSLGVREPRKPRPPHRGGGAAAPLRFEPELEAEGIAQAARLA